MAWTTKSVDAFICVEGNKWVRASAIIAVTPTDTGSTFLMVDGSAYATGSSPEHAVRRIQNAMSTEA